jgi:hypothetical protein
MWGSPVLGASISHPCIIIDSLLLVELVMQLLLW